MLIYVRMSPAGKRQVLIINRMLDKIDAR